MKLIILSLLYGGKQAIKISMEGDVLAGEMVHKRLLCGRHMNLSSSIDCSMPMPADEDHDHGGHNGAPFHGECASSSEDCISLA